MGRGFMKNYAGDGRAPGARPGRSRDSRRDAGATFLVAEVADAGEEHGQAQAIGGGDYFRIAL